MLTKLGLHVATGSRNGYGSVAAAAPAVVVAVGESGAFDELPKETVKVYRDVSLWGNTPAGYDRMGTAEIRRRVFDAWGPALEAIYAPIANRFSNVVFQPFNEPAANTPAEFERNIALDAAFCDYFTSRGYRVAVGNLSTDDPIWDHWKAYYLPYLAYVGTLNARHIYGRHTYGGVPDGAYPMLTKTGIPVTEGTIRPSSEAEVLWDNGIKLPVYLTEAGQNGGYKFPGVTAFTEDVAAYDRFLVDAHPNIGGFACWTYGNYQGRPANIEAASGWLASYLVGTEIAPVVFPENQPPTKHKAIVLKVPQEATKEDWLKVAGYGYDFRHTQTASEDDTLTILRGGNAKSYVKIYRPLEPSQKRTIAAVEAAGFKWEDITGAIEPTAKPFAVRHWPCDKEYKVTQAWGAKPEYYKQFGWTGGHEGIDFGVPLGMAYYAVDYGRVVKVSDQRNTGGASAYGWHIVIQHGGGYKTLYGHASARSLVAVGTTVEPGTVIGFSGNTGNSTGPHLHFSTLKENAQLDGFPAGYVDPTPFLWPAGKPGGLLDIASYMFPIGQKSRLYMVRQPNGSQEKYFTYPYKDGWLIQKNQGGEFYRLDDNFIYLVWDTTPDNDRYYVRSKAKGSKEDAPYLLRRMAVNQSWQDTGHYVQFYLKKDCTPSQPNSGNAGQMGLLAARHDTFTTKEGGKFSNVIAVSTGQETHYFAAGVGRIGWRSPWGEAWTTAEDLSDQQPDKLNLPSCML